MQLEQFQASTNIQVINETVSSYKAGLVGELQGEELV